MALTAGAIFALTYAGIALGRVPGLALDRTGIALLGAIAMLASGALGFDGAVGVVDVPTLVLLYALMVVSAQLRLGGFYTWAALRVARRVERPRHFLAVLMAVSAALSALLANDIVCLAFAPVLSVALLRAGLNPVPFLLGLATSSNIGSAATLIGNPQNMLIGQLGGLDFGAFFTWSAPPTLAALAAAYGVIVFVYRRGFGAAPQGAAPPDAAWPALDRWQTAKGLAVTVGLVGLFFTPVPRPLSALAAAGVLLCSRRMATRAALGLVDWHLITLFGALFVVVGGLQASGLPDAAVAALAGAGVSLQHPGALMWVSAALGNLVSNVPAVMLLVQFLDPATPLPWYALALASTFAGNLLLLGSIANLIVAEQARAYGVNVSFAEHARVGVPVTVLSLLIALGWLALHG